jgi:hypothetical protein
VQNVDWQVPAVVQGNRHAEYLANLFLDNHEPFVGRLIRIMAFWLGHDSINKAGSERRIHIYPKMKSLVLSEKQVFQITTGKS